MKRLALCLITLILPGTLLTSCGKTTVITESRDSGPGISVDISAIPDAVPRYEPRSRGGNPESYVVLGKRYHVMPHSSGYVQRGIASWYGNKFHGRKTSNGETYDMFAMTAAHKALPIPTYVRVTNVTNQRSIIVRINDRGPFHDNRIIDLSYVAAAKLGLHRTGTGQVEIRAIDPADFADAAKVKVTRPNQNIYLQVGAFADPDNANRLLRRIRLAHLPAARIQHLPDNGGSRALFRVQVGPLSPDAVDRVSRQLRELGIHTAQLVTEQPKQRSAMIQ